MKDTINIVGYDTWYSEKPWCRGLNSGRNFDVVHNKINENKTTYFIRDGIYQVDDVESEVKIALLTECRPFDIQDRYGFVERNNEKFDYIVSYDDQLIAKFPGKICPTPEGGTWVWPSHLQGIYKKKKLCSYIASDKSTTKEQQFRVQLLKYFYSNKERYSDIGLYGRGHNPFPENHDYEFDGKSIILKDYAFSITLENWVQDNYFSEKIMDCFMLGTVPIYMGARKILDYFNPDGIVLVDSFEKIIDEVNNLSFDKYQKMLPAIKENFERAQDHIDTISYSYNRYIRRKNET
jgi:hypothetical protein